MREKLEHLRECESLIDLSVGKYDTDPIWQLPEPPKLMTAHAYKAKIVEPLMRKLKSVIRNLVSQYLELKSTVGDLRNHCRIPTPLTRG